MSKTPIRAFEGYIIGYIEDDPITKIKTAYDFYMRKLGTYDAKLNITRTFDNRIVSRGDTLSALIVQAEAEYQAKRKGK